MLSLLTLQPTALLGYSYLIVYNVVFVLPLVVILIATSARPTLNRLAHWNPHHKEWVRLALGGSVAAMGLSLPCNVTVYEDAGGTVATAVDPVAMLGVRKDDQAVRNVAEEARARLKRVIESLKE